MASGSRRKAGPDPFSDLKGGKTLQSVSTGIQEDILYHVKIVAESGKVHVFWGEDPARS